MRNSSRAAAVAAALGVAAATVLAAPAAGLDVRQSRLASPGTDQPVVFDAAVGTAGFFSTREALTADDTDALVDVYRWQAGVLTLMTPETYHDVTFDAAASNASRVLVSVPGLGGPGDSDGGVDIFRGTPGSSYALSQGGASEDARFRFANPAGTTVIFDGIDQSSGSPTPQWAVTEVQDVPGSAPNQLALVTASSEIRAVGASTELGNVYVETDAAVLPGDHNTTTDVYVIGPAAGGLGIALVSNGTGGPDHFAGTTPDGSRAWWTTADDDASQGDTDHHVDIYRWAGVSQSLLVSGGNAYDPVFLAGSASGTTTLFSTSSSLLPADTDIAPDVYRYDETAYTLMTGASPGNQPAVFDTAAPDASSVVFSTAQPMPGTADTDTASDVYRGNGATATLLSGTGPHDVTWQGASADGSQQLFTSIDRLAPEDFDNATDLYLRSAAGISLISTGLSADPAAYAGTDPGGQRAWFTTAEPLASTDGDWSPDLYESRLAPDTTPPAVTVSGRTQPNDGRIEVTVACLDVQPCATTPTGVLRVATSSGVARYRIKGPVVTVGARRSAVVGLAVPSTARKAAAAALRAGRSVSAAITLSVRDPSGNLTVRRLTVRLRRS